MSAIAGIVQWRGPSADLESHLQHALVALAGYGPEGSGHWLGEGVGLGHQRMVITPEDALEQLPSYDAASGLVITADVRLDNREDLSAALGIPPSERVCLPDSHFILRAYEKWGSTCPIHLLGDFAFAIWDAMARTLFCSRDHIGAKPFYYSFTPNRCIFASDINGVLAVPGVSQQLDEAYVAGHLQKVNFLHPERTFFDAIRKLPPAHTLTVRSGAITLERYWVPERLPDVRLPSEAAYIEALLEMYTQAVEARVRSVHPVGAHVSGGLDSSSVAVLAAQALRRKGNTLEAFCWEPPPQGEQLAFDERKLIEAVCDQEALRPHYQCFAAEDAMALLQRDVMREPITDLVYEQLVQQQAAAQQVRVLLSGWGGDELVTFDGRGYYAALVVQGQWRTLARELRAPGGNVLRRLVMYGVLPLVPAWCQNWVARLRPSLVLHVSFQSYIDPAFARRMRREVRRLTPPPLRMVGVRRTQLQLLQLGHLTQRIESWAANAARHHVVYGYPLLDRRVVEFALGLPPEYFIQGGWSRRFARQALARLLPSEVVWNRNKSDPALRQAVNDVALSDMLVTVGHRLVARPTRPERAVYLDTPLLLRRLTAGGAFNPSEAGSLWHALQFLGS